MILSELRAVDFRNLTSVHLEPSSRFNIFEGPNGAGKTNLLEAIYLLGALKSFRPARNVDLIRFGATQADVRGIVRPNEGLQRVIRVSIAQRGRRVRIDGKAPRSLSDSLSQLTVVLFAPDDLSITKGSPSGRRRFLDRAIFNRWPASLGDMRRYEATLKQRNALLKDDGADGMLDVFDQQLAQSAAHVVRWRRQYLEAYHELFVESLGEVSGGELVGRIAYEAAVEAGSTANELTEAYLEAYARDRRRDRARRLTSRGPHVEDLDCTIGGRSARSYASQGQHRAFVLAMKIAEIRLLQQGLGHSPVLLLDDVSSELDARRNEQLMGYLGSDAFGGQVFLTTTDRAYVRIDSEHTCFTIREGETK